MEDPAPVPVYQEEEEEDEATEPGNPLSQDELDAMFAEPKPVEPLLDDEEEDDSPPDDIPDPDPIPQVFTDPSSIPEDEAGQGSSGLLAVLVALVVFAGLVGGLYFARDGVMQMIPASRGLYDLVGLGGERLGAGLEIRNIDFERETENNTDVLVVRGNIANTDKQMRPIPLIRVALYDAGSNPLQDMVMPPSESALQPGKDIEFRARFVDPSPLARRVEVTFAQAPATPKH